MFRRAYRTGDKAGFKILLNSTFWMRCANIPDSKIAKPFAFAHYFSQWKIICSQPRTVQLRPTIQQWES